jgi:hypothetical protein
MKSKNGKKTRDNTTTVKKDFEGSGPLDSKQERPSVPDALQMETDSAEPTVQNGFEGPSSETLSARTKLLSERASDMVVPGSESDGHYADQIGFDPPLRAQFGTEQDWVLEPSMEEGPQAGNESFEKTGLLDADLPQTISAESYKEFSGREVGVKPGQSETDDRPLDNAPRQFHDDFSDWRQDEGPIDLQDFWGRSDNRIPSPPPASPRKGDGLWPSTDNGYPRVGQRNQHPSDRTDAPRFWDTMKAGFKLCLSEFNLLKFFRPKPPEKGYEKAHKIGYQGERGFYRRGREEGGFIKTYARPWYDGWMGPAFFGVAFLAVLGLGAFYFVRYSIAPAPGRVSHTESRSPAEFHSLPNADPDGGQFVKPEERPLPDPEPRRASDPPRILEPRRVLAKERLKWVLFDLKGDPKILMLVIPKDFDTSEIDASIEAMQTERRSKGIEFLYEFEQRREIDFQLQQYIYVVITAQAEGVNHETIMETIVLGIEGLKHFPEAIKESKSAVEKVKRGFSTTEKYQAWATARFGSEARFLKWKALEIAAQKYKTRVEAEHGAVTETELQSVFNKNRILYEEPERTVLAQIFLRTPPESNQSERSEKEAEIKSIYQKLRAGAGFSELAGRYSEDGNGKQHGALGPVERDELAPDIAAEVFSLKPGEISRIIQTGKGYHIFKMIRQRTHRMWTLEEARAEIEPKLREAKLSHFMPSHTAELKKNLEIYDRGAGL